MRKIYYCIYRSVAGIIALLLFTLNGAAQNFPPIQWQKTLGGSGDDYATSIQQTADGGYIIAGTSNSPVSGDKTGAGRGGADYWIIKLNITGNIQWQKTIGGDSDDYAGFVQQTADGGYIVAGISNSSVSGDKTETDRGGVDCWIIKLNASGNIQWQKTLGGSGSDGEDFKLNQPRVSVQQTSEGGYIIATPSNSPVSGDKTIAGHGENDYWLIKLNASGSIQWQKAIGSSGSDDAYSVKQTTDGGYIVSGMSYDTNGATGTDGDKHPPFNADGISWTLKLDAAGNIQWQTNLDIGVAIGSYVQQTTDGGYVVAICGSDGVGGVFKLDAAGNTLWFSGPYGTLSSVEQTADGGYIIGGSTDDPGPEDYIITKLDPVGNTKWSRNIGGSGIDGGIDMGGAYSKYATVSAMQTNDGGYAVGGFSYSGISGDKTEVNRGGSDYWIVKLKCASYTDTVTNIISPSAQTACILGTPAIITGTDDDALYRDDITYQWQQSNNGTTWTNVAVGITKDYLPEPSSNTMYYRRIAIWNCHTDTSNVHTLNISADAAPAVDAGGPFYSCPGSPVTIGGTPTGTGGTGTLSYQWDNITSLNNGTATNPVATVAASTVFTLTVTDAAGCKKIDQAIVNIPSAGSAGPDKNYCAGGPGVQIGVVPLAGITATYSWSPTTDLSNPNIAQPIATPAATTDYTLTVTVTNSDGAICTFTDIVRITPVSPPNNNINFAGSDQVLCASSPATVLGTASVAGFSYTWAPGNYLTNATIAQPTFNAGSGFPISPDPITYTLTAVNGGCTFTDQVVVTEIRAFAGPDGCGPRILGIADVTPNVAETYSWVKLPSSTGNSNFFSATNIPQVSVGNNTAAGMTDFYEVSVTYGSTTCKDTVAVTGCSICTVFITARGGNCPLYRGSPLTLLADGGGTLNYTYSWSPATGLSGTSGPVVQLLDGVNRTYTVTKTSIIDPANVCTATIDVNNSAWSYPSFATQNPNGCVGNTVSLGAASVAGYSYSWTGPNGFTSSISNPSLTLAANSGGNYIIQITDVASGCFITDTATVTVLNVAANAGPDWTVCSAALVQLGIPDASGGVWTYSWSPAGANWQSGTNQNSPQPTALVATPTTFTLTVTNPATGCTATDLVDVFINSNPTIADAPDVIAICPGSSIIIGSPALPGVTYSWAPTTGLSDPNIAQPVLTAGTAGSSTVYTVTATFPGSCTVNPTDQVTVTVFNPDFNLGPDINYCPAGGAVAIGTNAPAGAASYSWSPAAGLSCTNCANPVTTVTTVQDYVLTVVYSNGCTGRDTIRVNPVSAPDAGFDRNVCIGSSVQIGNAANTGTTLWTGTGAAYLNNVSLPAPVFNAALPGGAPAGTYTLTLTQTIGSCTVSDNVTIIVAAPPSVTGSPASVCGSGCVNIGVAAQAGYTYNWLPSAGLSNASLSTIQACPATSVTYTLLVKNPATGCEASAQFPVTVISTPVHDVSVNDVSACIATPFTFSATVTPAAGNYSYVWSPATGLNNPYIAQPTATVNENTSYTLTVTDNATGCSNLDTVSVTVDVTSGHYITSSPASNTACSGSSVTMSTTAITPGSYNYQWQINQYGTWVNILNGGVFSGVNTASLNISDNTGLDGAGIRVLVTSQSGCGLTDTSNVAALTIITCGVVPVRLLYFNAVKNGKHSALSWSTATEQNSSHFIIERSGKGVGFQNIGSVQARGNSTGTVQYNFTDTHPLEATNYYRLKQIDRDGKFVLSEIRLVRFNGDQLISIFPNPTKDMINITGGEPGQTLIVTDATGRDLYYRNITGAVEQVQLGRFANGMYNVRILGKDGLLFSGKVLKQ